MLKIVLSLSFALSGVANASNLPREIIDQWWGEYDTLECLSCPSAEFDGFNFKNVTNVTLDLTHNVDFPEGNCPNYNAWQSFAISTDDASNTQREVGLLLGCLGEKVSYDENHMDYEAAYADGSTYRMRIVDLHDGTFEVLYGWHLETVSWPGYPLDHTFVIKAKRSR